MASDLTIQYKKTDDLIAYARNSRTHDDDQVAQIAASIREFGWTNPVYCDVIVKRWQEFTGDQATLEGDGRTFAEVSNGR